MTLKVVEEAYRTEGRSRAIVTVEGSSRAEVDSLQARNIALDYAREKNFPAHGLSGIPAPFPVDEYGNMTEALLHGKVPIAAWRAEVIISPGSTAI
jgi:hypothetical protein